MRSKVWQEKIQRTLPFLIRKNKLRFLGLQSTYLAVYNPQRRLRAHVPLVPLGRGVVEPDDDVVGVDPAPQSGTFKGARAGDDPAALESGGGGERRARPKVLVEVLTAEEGVAQQESGDLYLRGERANIANM